MINLKLKIIFGFLNIFIYFITKNHIQIKIKKYFLENGITKY